MRSNYKPIGEYIRHVKVKNTDLQATELLGININKHFMPSVANVVGTNLARYKVVNKNQFACNRMHVGRDYRIPVALSDREEAFMVSPAYDVFEIIDTTILLPEYLMMWFSRAEYDRNAWFYTDADVRGGLAWDAFCNMQFPLPSIEKQREIVAEYNTVKERITLNNQLIQKLEETAQAIYKQWFVDFEFPNEDGKPYKSSGGKMVWNEELEKEIPEGWEVAKISSEISIKDGTHDSPKPCNNGYPLVTSTHLEPYSLNLKDCYQISEEDYCLVNKRSRVEKYDILLSMIGTVGLINYVLYSKINFAIKNVGLFKTSEKIELATYILFYLKSQYIKDFIAESLSGSTQSYITLTSLRSILLLKPKNNAVAKFNIATNNIIETIYNYGLENEKLKDVISLLLSKLATIED